MPIDIVFETHSLTTDNEAGIATGWLPGELDERRHRWLCYTSPSPRDS
jgi:hypothetical protein